MQSGSPYHLFGGSCMTNLRRDQLERGLQMSQLSVWMQNEDGWYLHYSHIQGLRRKMFPMDGTTSSALNLVWKKWPEVRLLKI